MLDGIVIFFHVIFSILLIVLVLMHSGAQSGLGSIGGVGGGQAGGQHVMERNLDRLTVVVALLYLATTLTLAKIFT
ncbi:MAG: preprotein translocase subunit SecG [Thermoleophilia bacterium]|nr:preprotein translocase subunit SecG [Thermoleophilia bacterium]